jgi:hypothetical protein
MGTPDVNEWADFMPQVVTREPWTSYKDGGSNSNYGTAIPNIQCRIEMKNHLVVDKDGKVVTARGRVFLLSTTIPDIKDRWTLPAGYVPTQPPVLGVNVVDDESGNHHITLEIG